jgi:hypothetical protein
MGYVPYVDFATYRRATVKICSYFKRLTYMQMSCIKILSNLSLLLSFHPTLRTHVTQCLCLVVL